MLIPPSRNKGGKAACRRIAARVSRCSMLIDRPPLLRQSRRLSWVHWQAIPAVEPDGLHKPERNLRGEHVRGSEHPGVLFDDRGGRRIADRVEVALDAGPHVRAALLEVGRRIDGIEGGPRAGLEVGHVVLVQGDVLARAEPAQVATGFLSVFHGYVNAVAGIPR